MSTQRSLSALIDRAKTTMISKTGTSNTAIEAISCAIAGLNYGQYGHQDQLFRELSPETCSEDWLYVHAKRHKAERLLPTFATGLVKLEQLSTPVTVPKGTLIRTDFDIEYKTTKTQLSNVDISVIALVAGDSGNLPTGLSLKLSKSLGGINPDNVKCLGIDGGTKIESVGHWRVRVCNAFNKNQAIGRREDYEKWARSAHSDIDYAWALDNTPTLGMLEVYVGSRANNPTLPSTVIDTAQTFIDENRLAGCHPVVKVPTAKPIYIQIQKLDVDDKIKANVVTALSNLIKLKMGKRESITPTEIILTISVITSNYIVRAPLNEQIITNSELHTLGAVTWITA